MVNKVKESPVKSDTDEKLAIILSAKASKLNPKNSGFIYFEIKQTGNELHLRMTNNDGGGLYSKEWLPVNSILLILDAQKSANVPFRSSVLKPLFKSGSANNVSFLAAILRCPELALIAAVPSKMYSHQVSVNFAENKKKLLALAGKP